MKKQLENSIQTKDDISIFLNKRLQHKDDQIAEIQERLHGLEMVILISFTLKKLLDIYRIIAETGGFHWFGGCWTLLNLCLGFNLESNFGT